MSTFVVTIFYRFLAFFRDFWSFLPFFSHFLVFFTPLVAISSHLSGFDA